MNGPPVILRGYVPIVSGEHPDCNCDPDPVGYHRLDIHADGALHQVDCSITNQAAERAAAALVAARGIQELDRQRGTW